MEIEVRYDATSVGSLFPPAFYEQYLEGQDELESKRMSEPHPSLSATILIPWDEHTVSMAAGAPPTPQTEAVEALRNYVAWYRIFVDAYVRDLGASARRKPRRVRYGRELGPERLGRLFDCIAVTDHAQVRVMRDVFEGFEDLANLTTDLAGRGTLVVRLVEDVVRQLGESHLLREPVDVLAPHVNIALDTVNWSHLDQRAA